MLAAISNASSKNVIRSATYAIMDQTMSNKVLFLFSNNIILLRNIAIGHI